MGEELKEDEDEKTPGESSPSKGEQHAKAAKGKAEGPEAAPTNKGGNQIRRLLNVTEPTDTPISTLTFFLGSLCFLLMCLLVFLSPRLFQCISRRRHVDCPSRKIVCDARIEAEEMA